MTANIDCNVCPRLAPCRQSIRAGGEIMCAGEQEQTHRPLRGIQKRILEVLQLLGAASNAEIGAMMGVTYRVGPHVLRLVEKGLVARAPGTGKPMRYAATG
jgi:hypothetical protein